jgi:hypothetical protein
VLSLTVVNEGASWSFGRLTTDLNYHAVGLCGLLLLLLLLLQEVVVRVLFHQQVLAVRVAVAARR